MSTMKLERTIGKYEESEIKHACRRALAALRYTTRLDSPYKQSLSSVVDSLENILIDAETNTIKEERYHNHDPNYSIWSEEY